MNETYDVQSRHALMMVIDNPSTPIETIIELARSKDARIREHALANHRIEEKVRIAIVLSY